MKYKMIRPKITENWLREKSACLEGIEWFLTCKKETPLDILDQLIKEKQYDWANWLIVRVMFREQYLQYAIFAAEQVIDIFEKVYSDDKRPRKAIEAARAVLESDTEINRKAATGAANAAMGGATDSAYSVAYAAYAAADAADAAYAANAETGAENAATDAANAIGDTMLIKILEYGMSLLRGAR